MRMALHDGNADAGRRKAVDGGDAPAHGQQARIPLHLVAGAHPVRQLRRAAAEAPDAALQAEEKRFELCVSGGFGGGGDAAGKRSGGHADRRVHAARSGGEKERKACFRRACLFRCLLGGEHADSRDERRGKRSMIWVGSTPLSFSPPSLSGSEPPFSSIVVLFPNPRGDDVGLPERAKSAFQRFWEKRGGSGGRVSCWVVRDACEWVDEVSEWQWQVQARRRRDPRVAELT